MKIGAHYLGYGRCEFGVWAPLLENVAVRLLSPQERLIPMEQDDAGYWKVLCDDVSPGTRYYYRLGEDRDRADPASFFQPDGVHGPSQQRGRVPFFPQVA